MQKDDDLTTTHKLNLLKQLKLTFESFIFYGSTSKNWNNFTGLLNIFAKNIYSIIKDDFNIKSTTSTEINNNAADFNSSQLITQLWSFINETFTKIPDTVQDDDEMSKLKKQFLFIKNQMKSIMKNQIYFLNENENPVYEWICISLQMCNFYKQPNLFLLYFYELNYTP